MQQSAARLCGYHRHVAAASPASGEPDVPHCAPSPEALSRLDNLLGPGQVLLSGRDEMARYETDVLGRRSPACWVARPRDLDEVRSIVRWAYTERAELVVQGANTGPVLAGIPRAVLVRVFVHEGADVGQDRRGSWRWRRRWRGLLNCNPAIGQRPQYGYSGKRRVCGAHKVHGRVRCERKCGEVDGAESE